MTVKAPHIKHVEGSSSGTVHLTNAVAFYCAAVLGNVNMCENPAVLYQQFLCTHNCVRCFGSRVDLLLSYTKRSITQTTQHIDSSNGEKWLTTTLAAAIYRCADLEEKNEESKKWKDV